MTLRELRLELDLSKNYCFSYDNKDIKYEEELYINIKDIIINNNFIILKELALNINVIIDNINCIYSIKVLYTESLSDIRGKLKIKNKYKFLRCNKSFVLLCQENLYKIKDILINESDIHLKLDFSLGNHFSEKKYI